MADRIISRAHAWPALPFDAWQPTYETLHRWMQIVGKVRLTLSPWVNHSWGATLYPTASGVTTSVIPYGDRAFQIDFDFLEHQLIISTANDRSAVLALEPQSVARFYKRFMQSMIALDLRVDIHKKPNELADAIPFDEDETPRAYDPEYAARFWRVLLHSQRVMNEFRAGFIGKCSPVHLFWGALDLAVTRFSGRTAPCHPGGIPNLPDWVAQEAYSHEVSSCGFWPGGGPVPYAAFYAYAYPEPEGFSTAAVQPREAYYSNELREFVLPYDAVRNSKSPDETLLRFLQSTYAAGADLGGWDRQSLERREDLRSGRA
jgi:hypothetical protein